MSKQLDIYQFGTALIQTRDLDPLYVGLRAIRDQQQLNRWLLAYWCFYHAGVASYLSERQDKDYWYYAQRAAQNADKKWPRGTERRHFRGPKCVQAVQVLSHKFTYPEDAVASLRVHEFAPDGAKALMTQVQTWPMFGKWISFKVVDMLERCAGWTLSIPSDVVLMYDEPLAGLDILSGVTGLAKFMGSTVAARPYEFQKLLASFQQFKAPPGEDRWCGPAEVETILCKWKSYLNGHYWVGKDIHEQRLALAGWGDTAIRILEQYPPEIKRDSQRTGNERQRKEYVSPSLFDVS